MFCKVINILHCTVTLKEIGEVLLHLICANSFHVKVEKERFSVEGSRCCQSLRFEHFTLLFVRLCQKIVFSRLVSPRAAFLRSVFSRSAFSRSVFLRHPKKLQQRPYTTHAASLLFLIQPILSLICDIVVSL